MEGFILDVSKKKPGDEGYQELVQEVHDTPEQANRKRKTFHFPESKLKEMRETYSKVCVRDFGDDYHMSMSDKINQFDLYELFNPIRNHKTTYRRIEQYILAMRECYAFILAMAQKNRLVMDPDEFVSEVFAGRIEIAQLTFPKYKGVDRKDINWKTVRKYIVDSDLDPNDLSMKPKVEYLDKEITDNPEKYIHKFFTDEQIDFIFNQKNENHHTVYDPELDEGEFAVLPINRKEMKKFVKSTPEVIRGIKNVKNRIQADNEVLRDFVYQLDTDTYKYIAGLDEKRGFLASDRVPRFKGDINSRKDVNSYLYHLDEFMEEHQRIEYHGEFITLSQYKDEKLKDGLDEAGWNVMNIYSNKEDAKKKEREEKRDKKREKRLRRQLSKIEKRKEKRKGNFIDKKKSKPSKKTKRKMKAFDDVVAKTHGAVDYGEYESMMLDMTSGYKGE